MKKMFLHKLFDIEKIKHYVVKFFDKQQYYLFLCTTVVHYFLFKKKNTNLCWKVISLENIVKKFEVLII